MCVDCVVVLRYDRRREGLGLYVYVIYVGVMVGGEEDGVKLRYEDEDLEN